VTLVGVATHRNFRTIVVFAWRAGAELNEVCCLPAKLSAGVVLNPYTGPPIAFKSSI
jgi:hypothetical protein